MKTLFVRVLTKLFPVYYHEWPKVLVLLSVATLLGLGFSISRAASEALFLTRFGVQFLPYLLLVNPVLVFLATMGYGAFADRIANDRMLIYTILAPVLFILLMRGLIMFEMSWVYFLLYTFVLSYATVLTTSWVVYLSGHYDVQEAKRLLPFISSGILIGTVIGGVGVALVVPLVGAANVLLLWLGALLAAAAMVQFTSRCFTAMDAETRKVKRGVQRPGIVQNMREGIAFSRTSSLFMTTAVVSIATMMAIPLLDFEYSKIFARAFPDSETLTAFLGVFDGLTTVAALLLQWFVTPWCIRRFGVQGTNLLFPSVLTVAFGGLLAAATLPAAMGARFTRASLMPSLRGAARTLILNAVPRKMAARVRSFNTGVVMPLGQGAGALALLILRGLDMPFLFPLLGFLLAGACVYLSLRQNTAYGEALLDLLKEDKIHLLDLEDNEIRRLDANAIAAISARLQSDQQEVSLEAMDLAGEQGQFMQEIARAQEEETLAAVELLRTISSPQAFTALRNHLPLASPRLTAAALHALATIGGEEAVALLRPYLDDVQPQVRMAALAGLRHLGDRTLPQRAAMLLDDADVHVRAAALAVVLTTPEAAEYERAYHAWETMLTSVDTTTQMAALSVIASVPIATLQGHLYRALDHADLEVRREALSVLEQLAEDGRIAELDTALLRALEDDDITSRELALQVLAAIGTDTALEHMLVLLDDEQPQVREAFIHTVRRFGRRAIDPLLRHLRAPYASLLAKETALLALARLDGVQADQLMPFWEGALRDVYHYKLMLACLEEHEPLEADTFLRVALHDAHNQMLSLLTQLLAVWATPEVARLVADGLHGTDRHKRAHALEALESLSERRFTRLFLPILEATENHGGAWRELAQQQWGLACPEVPEVIETCLQSPDKWIVIGALLAGQAHAAAMEETWRQRLEHIAETADNDEVRHTARCLLGLEVEQPHHCRSLTDIMLFLKRVPLYSSMSLDQLYTITTNLTEQEVQAGEVIFREGDLSHEFYLIVAGKVDIVKQRGETDQTLATLSTGDFFGDMAIFENRPRSASAVAAESAALLILSPERFRHIVMQEPAISFEIFRELSARLRRFDQETLEVAS
jgi:CRP-like cAMP-binding protein/ATP/ADP translocase/HEAT repeat protein